MSVGFAVTMAVFLAIVIILATAASWMIELAWIAASAAKRQVIKRKYRKGKP